MFDDSSDSDQNHNPERDDFISIMLELPAVNRPAYEALRDEGWAAIAAREGRGRTGAELRAEALAEIGGAS